MIIILENSNRIKRFECSYIRYQFEISNFFVQNEIGD